MYLRFWRVYLLAASPGGRGKSSWV